jgi:hypothetical protein
MRTTHRVALACLVAAATGVYVVCVRLPHPENLSDLQQVLVAARAWRAHTNPYAAVAAWQQFPFPLLYPFTAVLAATPLTFVPTWLAEGLFTACGTGLLAWRLARDAADMPKLLVFVSAPFLHAIVLVQWSPLLIASALMPWAGFLLVCKPNIGLALFAAFPRWQAAAGGAVLIAVSVAIWPGWLAEWRNAVAHAPNSISLALLPGGVLLLLAALCWRDGEGRLLLALSLVPQTTLAYEALPLFLIARTWAEAWIIWTGTALALIGHTLTGPYASQLAWVRASGAWLLGCAYLPALVIVLLQKRELLLRPERRPWLHRILRTPRRLE